jgi:hypothetical protein
MLGLSISMSDVLLPSAVAGSILLALAGTRLAGVLRRRRRLTRRLDQIRLLRP